MEENIVSSVKTTEAADGARLEQIAPEKPPVSGGRKAGLIVGIVVGVLALAYIAACAVVQFLYNDTALPHTDVLGVDVSGQAAQQIEALWEQQGERVLHDTAVTLTESGESIGAVTLEELGVTVTPQAAAVAAGASRRYESWGGGALAWLRAGRGSVGAGCRLREVGGIAELHGGGRRLPSGKGRGPVYYQAR